MRCSTYYVSGTVLSVGNTEMGKTWFLSLRNVCIGGGLEFLCREANVMEHVHICKFFVFWHSNY